MRPRLDLEIGFVPDLDNAFERATSSFFKYMYSVHVQFRCLQRKKQTKTHRNQPKNMVPLKIKTAMSKSRTCSVLCRLRGSGGSMRCFQSPSQFQMSLWLLTDVCQMFYSLFCTVFASCVGSENDWTSLVFSAHFQNFS